MTKHSRAHRRLALMAACLSGAFLAPAALAEGPPMVNGVIANPTLVANQEIAKAQAAGVITTYMTQGATTCDDKGQNCHSLFGADDRMDYSTTQAKSQELTGVQSFSFQGEDGGSNAIASQTATIVLACGDTSVKTVAGVAFKATSCTVNTAGDAQMTVQVCTAPTRSNPVTQPDNAVACSYDPAAANFRAPFGKVCIRPACDTEPVNSLNGWSAPQTLSWQTAVAQGGTDDEKAKNGLGLVFYPALGAGIPANFKADSDNMTAVKIVQTFINSVTNRTAIGAKVAYRHKATVTKDMMVQGASSVPNPGEHTAQWDTILKLQGNALIPQYQEKYAKDGTECLQQIQGGIAGDGKISVCDQNYSNESGIHPLALTAQVAAEGQDCGTTAQCLQEVVNTNTWSQTCNSDVPLSMRSCTTKTDFTKPVLSYSRTRIEEVCTENRLSATYGCETGATASVVGGPAVCDVALASTGQLGFTGAAAISCDMAAKKIILSMGHVYHSPPGRTCPSYSPVTLVLTKGVPSSACTWTNYDPCSKWRQEMGQYCGNYDGNGTVNFTRYMWDSPGWLHLTTDSAGTLTFTGGVAAETFVVNINTTNSCTGYEAAN